MFKEKTKVALKIIATAILALFCVLPGCVSPNAVKMEVQGIRNDMNKLEKVAEELSVWKKSVQAEVINYNGAGWVVVGTGIMALIFMGSGLLLVRAFMKRGNMLTMLTRAVKKSGTDTSNNIKHHLKKCVQEGYHCDKDRRNLGDFAKKVGTFVEQNDASEV